MPKLGLTLDKQGFFVLFVLALWGYNWLSVNHTHLKCAI